MDEQGRRHVVLLNRRDTTHPEGGGSEVFLERTAARLVDLGWRVTVVCARHPGSPAREHRDGVRFVRSGEGLGLYTRTALAMLLGRFRPVDVVVDVQNGMPFCSPLFTRTPVVNLVHHVHRELWPVIFGPMLARVGWFAESVVGPRVYRGRRYVTVSAATRDELVGLGVAAGDITVVHNGTDVRPVPGRPRSDRPTILAVSRLVPHKRLEMAVEAVAALRPRLPDVRLVVAGTGYWEPRLRDAVDALGVRDHVELLGWVDEAHKHRLMAQAWVMAMPSLKEGWGLSVIEAAAHGTPTVAFHDAGGLSESVVDGETGLLVRGGTAEFTEALGRLLLDGDLRERMQAPAVAHALGFTWEATAWALHGVLEDAVGTGCLVAACPRHPSPARATADDPA
jgi:glycosyltransferase involved in cell wall biosynthesis